MSEKKDFHFEIQLAGGVTVREAAVSVYAITPAEPRLLASVDVTAPQFTVDVPVRQAAQSFYAVAEVGSYAQGGESCDVGERTVQLVSVFRDTASTVALSEPLSVATAYCFNRFSEIGDGSEIAISDPNRSLDLAYGIKERLVTVEGAFAEAIQSPPNGLQTNSLAMLDFLANLFYYGLVDQQVYDGLLQATGAGSLYGALLALARQPFTDPQTVYSLISEKAQPYSPSLPELSLPEGTSPVPDQWTLTLKVNDSGAQNFMIGGVGYIAFDCNDRAWMTNNVRQGTPNSSTFCVVLEPDGSPAPFSPLFGGGLLGGGFGVAANPARDKVYLGNYGWGPMEWNPQTGSVSVFSAEGEVLSPPNGFTQCLSRVQGMAFDRDGNLWICSWGNQDPMAPAPSRYHFESQNSAVVVYLGGDPEQALTYCFDSPYHQCFDVAFDDEGYAYVSNSGNRSFDIKSSVCKLRIDGDRLEKVRCWESDYQGPRGEVGHEAFRQIAVSPTGYVYVGGVTSSRVVKLDRDLRCVGELKNQIHGPWGITFDDDGVMYVANFLREMSFEASDPKLPDGPHGVTVIHGEDESTARLMTLPTGGEEVTLANGLPLYGNPETSSGELIPLHSYDPLMRLTATCVDRAGNLWACNNWKPSGVIDIVRGNPGGDGVVIFVGAAAPWARERPRS